MMPAKIEQMLPWLLENYDKPTDRRDGPTNQPTDLQTDMRVHGWIIITSRISEFTINWLPINSIRDKGRDSYFIHIY